SGSIAGMPGAQWLATARIRPEDACIATIAAEPGAAVTARVAACWTPPSIVVCTEAGGRPDHVLSTLTVCPLAVAATTSVFGVPVRSAWERDCRPDRPTVAPGR